MSSAEGKESCLVRVHRREHQVWSGKGKIGIENLGSLLRGRGSGDVIRL